MPTKVRVTFVTDVDMTSDENSAVLSSMLQREFGQGYKMLSNKLEVHDESCPALNGEPILRVNEVFTYTDTLCKCR